MHNLLTDLEGNGSTVPRQRGRPRKFDREKALSQAMRLFWAKGYSATSISDLTDAMGIGSKSLYAAFTSKEELYVEALEHYSALYDLKVWAGFDLAPTARDAVAGLLRNTIEILTRTSDRAGPWGCMVLLSTVGDEGYADLGQFVRKRRGDVLARIESRLARAKSEGELPPDCDEKSIARFFFTVQGGLSLQARDGATASELERAVQAAVSAWEAVVSSLVN